MNKRNFFKGLMALLAMPSNIYAKMFTNKSQLSELLFLKEVDVESFGQLRAGMFFTTLAWWGSSGELFEVTGIQSDEHSNYAFVTPRNSIMNSRGVQWPSGSSRRFHFGDAVLSEFTFYARA